MISTGKSRRKIRHRTVASYLNDVQKLEDLPEPEKKKLRMAQNIRSVKQCEKYFRNSRKTDRCTVTRPAGKETLPDAIKPRQLRMIYQDTIKDMKYLEQGKIQINFP